jgi:hypothetical protein
MKVMSIVFLLQRSKAQSLATKVTSAGRTLDDILADMKSHFEQRGVRGIVALQRRFRIMDDDNSGTIDMPEFKKAMRECSINLSDEVSLFCATCFVNCPEVTRCSLGLPTSVQFLRHRWFWLSQL